MFSNIGIENIYIHEKMNTEEINEQLAKCKQTHYLLFSSSFFLVPVYYGLSCRIYSHTILLFICWLASVNYWRKPVVSIRRTMDLIMSNVTMIDYTIHGFLYVRNPLWFVIGITNGTIIGYAYYTSTTIFHQKLPYWWKYHMLFHLFCAINQTLVLSFIHENIQ